MTKKNKSSAGFSIVELLLYMGLFMGFLTILGAFFVTTLETQSDAVATSKVDQDSWYVLTRLQRDLYQASNIITPAANGESASELVLDIEGTQVTYSLVDDKLVISQDSETLPLVSNGVVVNNLSFTKLGNEDTSSVDVQMDLSDTTGEQTKNIDFTVGLRL